MKKILIAVLLSLALVSGVAFAANRKGSHCVGGGAHCKGGHFVGGYSTYIPTYSSTYKPTYTPSYIYTPSYTYTPSYSSTTLAPVTKTTDELCKSIYGSNVFGKTSDGLCYCNSGYSWNSTKTSCVENAKTCPDMVNGFLNPVDNSCYCNAGYLWDDTSKLCVTTKSFELKSIKLDKTTCEVSGLPFYDGYIKKCVSSDYVCSLLGFSGYDSSTKFCK